MRPLKSISVILIVALAFFVGCSSAVKQREPDRKAPLLLLGFDGATWSILLPMMKMGQLPVFSQLYPHSARSLCRTLLPTLSPLIWTSIATGRTPSDHGINHFVRRKPFSEELMAYTAEDRKVPALWDIMTARGREGVYVNWLMSWPASPVKGIFIGDRIEIHHDRYAWPETWDRKLTQMLHDDQQSSGARTDSVNPVNTSERRPRFAGQKNQNIGMISFMPFADSVERQTDLFLEALSEGTPDLALFYLNNIDPVEHRSWLGIEPSDNARERKSKVWLAGRIMSIYRQVDSALGRILDQSSSESDILIVSDHGMESRDLVPFRTTQRDISFDSLLVALDLMSLNDDRTTAWGKTKVYTISHDRFGGSLQLGVNPQSDGSPAADEICAVLTSIKDVTSNQTLVSSCSWNDRRQQIDLLLNPELEDFGDLRSGDRIIARASIITRRNTPPGFHHNAPPGVLMMHGPSIRPGLIEPKPSVFDVFPTVAALLGLPVARDMPGNVLIQSLTGISPPEVIDSYGFRKSDDPCLNRPHEQDFRLDDRERHALQALGYIE